MPVIERLPAFLLAYFYLNLDMINRYIDEIILHCSQSDHSHHNDIMVIDEWHKARGFKSKSGIHCGYHFFITRAGRIQEGRPLDETGAHAKGHNANSIGICMHGDTTFSEEQFKAQIDLIHYLQRMFTIKRIIGHCEVSKKTCPNYDVKEFLKSIP